MTAYADTSFLVSLYALDTNSARAAASIKAIQQPVVLTWLGQLELTNALQLRLFRRELSSAQRDAARTAFRDDISAGVYSLKPMRAAVFELAERLANANTATLGVRTLDILHVASAVIFEATTFYTFDKKQAQLASQAGLATP